MEDNVPNLKNVFDLDTAFEIKCRVFSGFKITVRMMYGNYVSVVLQ